MKAFYSLSCLFGVCIIIAVGIFSMPTTSSAQVPQMINYQGKLTKATGAPLDTTISMVFTIYADSNGTTSKWSESQSSVKVEKGVFNVLLGCVVPIPDSVFDGSIRYLGVKVGDDPEITPRKPMVSTAYAYKSFEADTADYAKGAPPVGQSLGAWVSKSNNTVYQAATDGFVTATGNAPGAGWGTISGYTDSGNPPSTLRGRWNDSDGRWGSITIPVKKNDYWKIEGSSNPELYIYWIPMGS